MYNILCLGGKITGIFEVYFVLDVWLTTTSNGGRHDTYAGLMRNHKKNVLLL